MASYSEAELKLIGSFSTFNQEKLDYLLPFEVYATLERIAFRENLQGSNVEALRRIANSFGKTPRLTPEFDKLCSF